MKKIIFFVAYSLLISTAHSRPENETPKSGRWSSPLGENAAIGVNSDSKTITGFYHYVNRAMPGYSFHADCTILFSGKPLKNNMFSIYSIDAGKQSSKSVSGILFFDGSQKFSSKALAEQLFRIKLGSVDVLPSVKLGVLRSRDEPMQRRRQDEIKRSRMGSHCRAAPNNSRYSQ